MAEGTELIAFGATLRLARTQKGLSQEALALQCGLDRTYVGRVERGERNLSLKTIVKLAKGLGLRPAELMEGM